MISPPPLLSSPPLPSYLMHHVYSKVYPAVCGVHAKYDRQFNKRCQLLRGKLTPSVVGVPRDYECQYPSTLAPLRLLDSLETPLEILYAIQQAMVSNMAALSPPLLTSFPPQPTPLLTSLLPVPPHSFSHHVFPIPCSLSHPFPSPQDSIMVDVQDHFVRSLRIGGK